MATSPFTQAIGAEQLMLAKMDAMKAHVAPQFVVTANPIDHRIEPSVAPLSFADAVNRVLTQVNAHQSHASDKMTAVELGQSDDLVGAMVASQKASLSFDALMQVRNKVVGAVDEIMKMPV
ncbi:flagellar hook-basal body complex protein FliE [Vibrio sp. SM6]|uniref:Flagellar hook-basal body complex protein FliE n=1 Tax=Vibrio agarilyticus TaxID=2726741 RepID=A0A7X8YHU0_9VIBR|nr:flagellar hook-basal body complex protein FliE [Vibrio agarilyticus]NLS13702.1 flagellar hook-basal body complex protein FliE [Vibrio agarilyticus]